MPLYVILVIVAALLAGCVIKYFLDKTKNIYEITKKEFIIGSVIISLITAPITVFAGWSLAKANNLSFNEYWNGYEKTAQWEITTCSRDGPCVHEYSCDPYLVHVIDSYAYTDSDGNYHPEVSHWETHYHDCPYTTEEWTFTIDTTLGSYTVAANNLPTNPDSHRWDGWVAVPTNISSGIPSFWAAAKQRIDSGKPGPVTKRMQYDNYILASDKSILNQYSDKIEQYTKDKLLPDVANSVHEFYYADKVYFVGYEPIDKKFWQTTLMYLNAALGTELQGDLHIVIVQNAKISAEKDAYITALKAYWSDPKVFGDDTVSKNAIIVVVGTEDGQTVSWARATTGMPLGNEYMLNQIQNKLPGTALTPEALIGIVNGEFYTTVNDKNETKLKVRGLHGNGILNRLLWGLDDAQTKFKRVSMTGNSEDDNGNGFLYLADELEPSDGEKILFAIIGFGVSMLVWAGAILYGERIQKFTGRFRRNSIFGDQNTWR